MPRGPGKYDDLCTMVREHTGAQGVLIAVIGGDRGDGMSLQALPDVTAKLPQLLRRIASDIQDGVEDEDQATEDGVSVLPDAS
jgi:hypothetical protein